MGNEHACVTLFCWEIGLDSSLCLGLDNLRAMRGTQVSLKNTPVSLNSTQVSLSNSPVSLMVIIYVGSCSRLASLAFLARMARTFGSLAGWLAHWPHSLCLVKSILKGSLSYDNGNGNENVT